MDRQLKVIDISIGLNRSSSIRYHFIASSVGTPIWRSDNCNLRLLTHIGFLRQNDLILSEIFLYMEGSKNQEKIYHNRAKNFHLPEEI